MAEYNLGNVVGNQGSPGNSIKGDKGLKGDPGDRGDKGEKGDQGTGIHLSGTVSTYKDLNTGLGAVNAGEAYLVKATSKIYVWSGSYFPAESDGLTLQSSSFTPHLWPTDGSEVNLGDGSFGRHWVNSKTPITADTWLIVNLMMELFPTAVSINVSDFGGWLSYMGKNVPIGDTSMDGSIQTALENNGGYPLVLGIKVHAIGSIANFDFWFRYTK